MIARLRGVAGAMLAGLMVYGCISIATQTGVRPDPPEPRGAPGTPAARAPRAVTPGDLTVSDYVRDLTAQRDTLDTIIQQYQGTTPPVPTATLSASPGSVQTGGASTLTWSSTNATGCTASGAWSGAKASSGSESRTNLQANSTYSLACAGAGGTSQAASTTVTVTAIPPPTAPTAMLSAAPTSMQPGGSSTLTWSSTNATGCTATGSWTGSKATSGTQAVTPAASATYLLACAGTGGTSPAVSATVTVSTTPPVPSGAATFQLTSPMSGTHPFTVGMGFPKGAMPSGTSLVTDAATTQVVAKALWNDNSVKHAIVSGRAALTAGTPMTVTVRTGTPATGTSLTAADIQKANPGAVVTVGSLGTVTLASLLATPQQTWISGPQMVEAHYRAPVGSDPALVVWYHVRLWQGGRVWIRAIVDNGFIDQPSATKSYTGTVTIGGAAVYSAAVTHYANTRWSAEGWVGGADPQVTPKHDPTYLASTKLVPHYWKRNPTDSAFSGFAQAYTPMQRGNLEQSMGAAGYQDSIGLLPRWDALYVTSGDLRAYKAVLANSSSLNTFPVVWRDSKTTLVATPTNHPEYAIGGGVYNWSAGPNTWEMNHAPSEGYLAYLITGDYWHYETMLMNASINYLAIGSRTGKGVNRILTGETRGMAWNLRTLVQLAGIAPSGDAVAADYRLLLQNNMAHWQTVKNTLGGQGIGYLYEYSFPYGTGTLAPWQEHFVIQAHGHGSDLEPLANMAVFNDVRDWWYRAAAGILGDSTGYCFTEASTYTMKISNGSDTNPQTWFPAWSQVYGATWGAKPCGNALTGLSDPATIATGYWGNLLPAIAYAVDHGAPGASASYARLQGASNYAALESANWANFPIWGIVPRGTAPPPPGAPTATLSAAPPTVASGTASTLTWSSTNATGCTAGGAWSGGKAPSGTQSVTPTATSAYTLACEGAAGTSPTATTTVTVSTSTPVPTATLSAAPTTVQAPQSSTLTWSSTNATSCTASGGWKGTWAVSGSAVVTPASTTAYSIACAGAGGTSPTVSTTIAVTTGPPPAGMHSAFASMTANQAKDLGIYTCTQMAGDQPCHDITEFSRLIYSPVNRKMLMFGGGHATTFRDDVDTLDLAPGAPLTWSPDQAPTSCGAMTIANMDRTHARWTSTGHPFSRHTYDMLVMTPTEMLSMAGTTGRGGCAPQGDPDPFFMQGAIHHYNPLTKLWALGGQLGNWAPYAQAEYDPPSGRVLVIGYNTQAGAGTIWVYDPVTKSVLVSGVNNPDVGYAMNLVYFPPNQKHYLFKASTVFEVTLNRTNWGASTITQLSTTGTPPGNQETGYAYDSVNQLIGGAISNGVIRFFNPVTRAWTSRTMAPISGTVTAQAFHAIDYDPTNNVYIFITDPAGGRRTWAYRY